MSAAVLGLWLSTIAIGALGIASASDLHVDVAHHLLAEAPALGPDIMARLSSTPVPVPAEDGTVDAAGTERLRDEMRADRPAELPVFDMGPPIEELLARCEEETGLPAPKRPVWVAG